MKIGFVTVYTDKMIESVKFYTEILGFKVANNFSPRPGMEITFLADDSGSLIEFIQEDHTPKYNGKGISIGFDVQDIHETLDMLKSNNVKILGEPIKMPNGVILLHALDLNDLALTFIQYPI